MEEVLQALHINFSSMALQAVNLLVVIAVLYKLLYRPVLNTLDERDKKINNDLDEAKKAREEANKKLEEYQESLNQVKEEAREIVAEAKKNGEKTREQILTESRKEAQEIMDKAKREIEEEKEQALEIIRSEAVTLAVLAASRVVRKDLDTEDNRRLVKEFVEEVGEIQ